MEDGCKLSTIIKRCKRTYERVKDGYGRVCVPQTKKKKKGSHLVQTSRTGVVLIFKKSKIKRKGFNRLLFVTVFVSLLETICFYFTK